MSNKAILAIIPTTKERMLYLMNQIEADSAHINESISADKFSELITEYIQTLNEIEFAHNEKNKDKYWVNKETFKEAEILVDSALEKIETTSPKISAIKSFRTITGASLKDSKNEVERVFDFENKNFAIQGVWKYEGKIFGTITGKTSIEFPCFE